MSILTEEELKERNRLLVLENDEQTAEIVKLRALVSKIANSKKDSQRPSIMEQIAYVSVYYHHDEMIVDAKKLLEELK